jgi:uncharacterized membrane protein YbhN (UPF0104 family)
MPHSSDGLELERRTKGRWLRVAGSILSVSLLVWLVAQQDWRRVLELAWGIPIQVIVVVGGLIFSRYIFQTLRWLFLLHAQRVQIGFGHALRLVLTGLFASNFLPSTIGGDVVRLIGIVPAAGGVVVSGASLVVDRAIGVMSMIPYLPISIAVLGDMRFATMTGMSVLTLLPQNIRSGVEGSLNTLKEALRLWISKPWSLAMAFLLSSMGALVYILGMWLLARGIGIEVSLFEVAGISAATYFITLIPISINGYGVREIGVVTLYTRLGVSVLEATTLALVSRVVMLSVSLPGAIWLPGALTRHSRQ